MEIMQVVGSLVCTQRVGGLAGVVVLALPAAAALAASGSQWSMIPTIVRSLG